MTKPIPEGHRAVTPYLIVKGAAQAIAFYKNAFGATEEMTPLIQPDGRIGHAELTIGDSKIMLADEFPERDIRGPQSPGASPVSLHLYVEAVDAVVERAVIAGAIIKRPVQDQFYGDRSGSIVDPFGHVWHVATHIEDLEPEELRRRAELAAKQKESD